MTFPPGSRYHDIPTAEHTAADGRIVRYVRRRFLPPIPPPGGDVGEHVVAQGDRLDNVTAQYLGDPEQFWRLCDANGAMWPDELTAETGRRLRIPNPFGA